MALIHRPLPPFYERPVSPVSNGGGEPNLNVPLTPSYNVRGIAGYTNTVTNALDQRRLNCIYNVVINPTTGKPTLNLCKRPGVADAGETYGASSQTAFLWETKPAATGNTPSQYWVFSTSGNDCRASDNAATTTTILSAANYQPQFVDKTHLSGTENLVIQLRRTTDGDQRVYFSTAIGTFTEISDADFTALGHRGKMEFMDGYAFILAGDTNRIHNSDLNSLANWTATSYIQKQIMQDAGLGLARLRNQIIAFGGQTMEVFVNAGYASGSPLKPVPHLFNRIGLGTDLFSHQNYYTELGGRMYFRGTTGRVGLHAWDGQRLEKVSNSTVDAILAEQGATNTCTMALNSEYGVCLALTARDATTQRWLVFFPAYNEWFEYSSTVFQPVTSPRVTETCLGAGTNADNLFVISQTSDNWQDAGTNYDSIVQFKMPGENGQRQRMSYCGLVADVERSAATTSVSFSDDDGQNWSSARTIDRTSTRQRLYGCGSYYKRHVRLTNSSNHEGRIESFIARID